MNRPIITIGLYVRNGAAHLPHAIESLLHQRFRALELVIYDNASTDRTFQIAQQYAGLDQRVRVVRHAENIGALGNLIAAAEHVSTPYFCWAAHDDLRELAFLQTLVDLLEAHPAAGFSCCAVRNIDPDGTPRELRAETDSWRTTCGMSATQRLLLYLKDAPATPFYGVFRTSALHQALPLLRQANTGTGPPPFGVDVVFLAGFVNRFDVAVTHEPLLQFRRGGLSHRVDLYRSIGECLADLRWFARALAVATSDPRRSMLDRNRVRLARWRYLTGMLLDRAMRRRIWHALAHSMPSLMNTLQARWALLTNPAFRTLRRRARRLPAGARVVLFGAGKHTRRCLPAIRAALSPRANIVGVCDDAAAECEPVAEFAVTAPSALESLRPDVVLVSSDTYEAALHRCASAITPTTARLWSIYDRALETGCGARSSCSTEVRNASTASSASISAESHAAIAPPILLMDSTNARR